MPRTQLNSSWVTNLSLDSAMQRVRSFLSHQNMKVISERASGTVEITCDQGSQFTTRMLGGWVVDPVNYPKRAKICLHPTSGGLQVEITIWETLGFGLLDSKFKRRYEEFFGKWAESLKLALPPEMGTIATTAAQMPGTQATFAASNTESQIAPEVTIDAEFEHTQAASETIRVPRGVIIKVKRSRTIEHTMSIDWDTTQEGGVEAGLKQILSISIRRQIEQKQGRSYQQSETIEYEVELNGDNSREYTLVWTDAWRKGIVEIKQGKVTKLLPFKFRERTELEVIQTEASVEHERASRP